MSRRVQRLTGAGGALLAAVFFVFAAEQAESGRVELAIFYWAIGASVVWGAFISPGVEK